MKAIVTTIVIAATVPLQTIAEPVTLDTFVRAETDTAMRLVLRDNDFGSFVHFREPASVDAQSVIRMNRDTLYSSTVLDLSEPATVILPEGDGRYQSVEVINQDHYMFAYAEPGSYELTEDLVGSRYAYLIVRTFVDPNDPEDLANTHAMQDGLGIEGGGKGPFEAPDWDQDQLLTARQALNTLAGLGFDLSSGFGEEGDVDPVAHLVAAAAGWGGLPPKYAVYQSRPVPANDGKPHSLTLRDVPVDAFWSVTVYNADGYLEKNPAGIYSYNSVTATPDAEGAITLHFGGCDDGRVNCIPVPAGWNYIARLYGPQAPVLDGSWVFPVPEPLD